MSHARVPAPPCNTLQHPAAHSTTQQHTATYCYTLLHIATHLYLHELVQHELPFFWEVHEQRAPHNQQFIVDTRGYHMSQGVHEYLANFLKSQLDSDYIWPIE